MQSTLPSYSECVESDSFYATVALKNFYYRFFKGKNILAHQDSMIRGVNNISLNGVLKIGVSYVGFCHPSDRTYLNVQGKLRFKGDYSIGRGCRIHISQNATAEVGEGFVNANSNIVIDQSLLIGDGCAISWGCQFLDTDFHQIDYAGKVDRGNGIQIGNKVLICCNSTILKGSVIPDGCVVAAGSVVNKAFSEPNSLIAGVPARVMKSGVSWS